MPMEESTTKQIALRFQGQDKSSTKWQIICSKKRIWLKSLQSMTIQIFIPLQK